MLKRLLLFAFIASALFAARSFFVTAQRTTVSYITHYEKPVQGDLANFGGFDMEKGQVQYVDASQPGKARPPKSRVRPPKLKPKKLAKLPNAPKKKKVKTKTKKKNVAKKGEGEEDQDKNKKNDIDASKVAQQKKEKKMKGLDWDDDNFDTSPRTMTQQNYFAGPPADDNKDNRSPDEEEEIDFRALWSDRLFEKPDLKVTAEFVRAFNEGELKSSEYYSLVLEMLDQDDPEYQKQALLALNGAPSVVSYRILVGLTQEDGTDTGASDDPSFIELAQRELDLYADLAYVPILKLAIKDKDIAVSDAALNTINLLLVDLNDPNRTIAEEDRDLRAFESQDPAEELSSLLPELQSLCDDTVTAACNTFDDVRSFVPDESVAAQFNAN